MSMQTSTSTPSAGQSAASAWPLFRNRRNVVQIPYRGVSVQHYNGGMTEREITNHFMGREAYRRNESLYRGSTLREAGWRANG